MKKLLKKIAIGTGYLAVFAVTAIALFYSVTSYQGRKEWASAKKDLESRGEKLSMGDFVPPPLADELNLFAAPAFAELASEPPVPPKELRLASLDVVGAPFRKVPRGQQAALSDLALAAAYYQENGQASAGNRPPAEIVMEALEPARSTVEEITRYAERPGARFPVRYEEGISAKLPHLSHLNALARYLSVRALASMELGRGNDAAADILLTFRLADALKSEPLLVSQLVRCSLLTIACQSVWQGIARGAWSDAQLAAFTERLRGYDLPLDAADALWTERGQMLTLIETALRQSQLGPSLQAWTRTISDGPPSSQPRGFNFFLLYPTGWIYADMAFIADVNQRWIDALERKDGLRPAEYEFLQAEFAKWSYPTKLKHILSSLALPSVVNAFSRIALTQTAIDQARTACALERYRLAQGEFPEDLNALVPAFLEAAPRDVMTAESMNYQKLTPDDFILWSMGWDAANDQGKSIDPKTKKGDVVWRRQPQEVR